MHNRVESIEQAAARLRELVPEARVAVAHGQMGEDRLEQVIVDFWEKQFDVLVCTTIVETGLDISNANTLIVERADMFGLSQLHQLRGRVGPRPGAGLRLLPLPAGEAADRDRARAAGHHRPAHRARRRHVRGHEGPGDPRRRQPARRRAVRPHRGRRLRPLRAAGRRGGRRVPGRRPRRSRAEVKIELPVDAHLPHDYVPGERLRLEAYRKLADGRADEAVWPRSRPSCSDRYGTAARAGATTCSRWPGSGARAARPGSPTSRRRATTSGSRRWSCPSRQQLRLKRLYPGSLVKPAVATILVPRPTTARVGGEPLRGLGGPGWASDLIDAVLLDPWPGAVRVAAAGTGTP